MLIEPHDVFIGVHNIFFVPIGQHIAQLYSFMPDLVLVNRDHQLDTLIKDMGKYATECNASHCHKFTDR